MSLITRTLNLVGLERRSVPGGDPYWSNFQSLQGGTVNATTAQSVASVYAAVGLIAEAVGSLPLKLYRRTDSGDRNVANEHPLAGVLHRAPNEHQSPQEFWEWMASSMLLTGNAYARVFRGFDGQVRAMLPMQTERVQVLRKGELIAGYDYTDRDGKRERLLPGEVFHLRNRAGNDPLLGVSPITAARQVIQLAQSEAQHGQSVWDNGTRASGILSMPGMLKQEQRVALANSWQSQYAGGANSGKVPILENGVSYTPISMSLSDSEFVASRAFSVQEICRLFKVPPIMLADLSNANYSLSTEMNRWFATHTLGRHLSAIEGAINRQLLTPQAARTLYAEFSLEGLLRGASTERAAFYSSAIASGWMKPSEARAYENLKVIDGIDDAVPTTAPAPFGAYPSKQV